jgi:hypothetical protein
MGNNGDSHKFEGGSDYREISKKMVYNSFIAELMRKQLGEAGIKDAITIAEWQEKAEKLAPDQFIEEAKAFASTTPAFDLTPLQTYISATKITTLDAQASVAYEVGDEIKNALLPQIDLGKKNGMSFICLSTDLNMSYEQSKRALRQLLPYYFNDNTNVNPNEIILPFVISKERCLTGQVISNLDAAKKSVTLVTAYTVAGEFIYQFFGETKPTECKKIPAFSRYNALFYVYKFQSDSSEDVFLLSPRELEITSCKIHGMEANCYDFLKIGNMARISTTQKVFFVHSQEPAIDKIEEKQFWEYAKEFDSKERIQEALFGKYPHPEWFSAFIASWIFSGKLGNMPTHLSLMSPPAQGKTAMLENLGKVFDQSLNDGGTLKGLVPSFANGVPKEGYLIRCKRFAFVDEFIHIIQSSARNGSDFDGGSYQLLKVLEHSEGEFSSAFGIIKAKPKMWVMFCSNIRPYEHIKNLVDLHSKLNAAFMSRILWYIYDKEHLDYIQERKSDVMTYGNEAKPKKNPHLTSMADLMHSFTIKIPIKIVEEIHAKYRPLVPANLELDIYDSRMIMHIYRILDGYAKYKSIIEQRGRFIYTPEDVAEVDEIIGRIVRSWSVNLDENQLTSAMKIAYLNAVYREIYDFIKMNQNTTVGGGVDEPTLRRLKGDASISVVDELVKKGILKQVVGGCRIFFTYDANT